MSIPIFIITRDRVRDLRALLARLDQYDNVTLVDCASTYEPLIQFLEETDRKVVRLTANVGHRAPWLAGLVPERGFYAVTDPDVVPSRDCPSDFVEYLQGVAQRHPDAVKVGLGLRIDDLPDHYKYKRAVEKWEGQFWNSPASEQKSQIFHAPVDTTFAVYRPGTRPGISPAIRTGHPYVAHHMPWYADSDNPTEEELYYSQHADRAVTSWLHDDISPVLKKVLSVD